MRTVVIHGQPLVIHGEGDGLSVSWQQNGDGFVLMTYDASLTIDEFVEVASGVGVPPG